MRDLVAANFRRMFKNSLFWGGVLFMFFVAVVELVSSKIEVLSGGSSASSVLDSLLYDGALRLATGRYAIRSYWGIIGTAFTLPI